MSRRLRHGLAPKVDSTEVWSLGWGAFVCLALLLESAPSQAADVPQPVAVALSSGRMEDAFSSALTYDLRTGAGIDVVPYQRVYAARRGKARRDEAVKIAQSVGAQAVVTGSVNNVDDRLVFDVRLVDVRTGAVLASAEEQGPEENPVAVQDAALKKLLGSRYRPPERRCPEEERQNDETDTPRAYSKYDLSFGSDNRHRILEEALKNDEHFVYACHDLAEIEQEAAGLARRASLPPTELDEALKKLLLAGGTGAAPWSVDSLLRLMRDTRHLRAMATFGERIERNDAFPVAQRALGLFWQHQALIELNRPREAIAACELFLEKYRGEAYFNVMKSDKKRLEEQLEKQAKKLGEVEKELRKLDQSVADKELDRCEELFGASLHLRALNECEDFLGRYCQGGDLVPTTACLETRWRIVRSKYETREFAEAQRLGRELMELDPAWAAMNQVEFNLSRWPKE